MTEGNLRTPGDPFIHWPAIVCLSEGCSEVVLISFFSLSKKDFKVNWSVIWANQTLYLYFSEFKSQNGSITENYKFEVRQKHNNSID